MTQNANFSDNVYFKVPVCLFTWPDSIFVAHRLKDKISVGHSFKGNMIIKVVL